ncbi:MAG: hypothetical protein KZQ85_11065, partial [Candidatus Thiodiazotropha sp. (ex Myrtea sp. 'scaly one' KF741663)]|nr:hypothetical protein [Candidatus Thiodiazotropha sp. (ex Myrtea sp. 'scaly one' KF741663)]
FTFNKTAHGGESISWKGKLYLLQGFHTVWAEMRQNRIIDHEEHWNRYQTQKEIRKSEKLEIRSPCFGKTNYVIE